MTNLSNIDKIKHCRLKDSVLCDKFNLDNYFNDEYIVRINKFEHKETNDLHIYIIHFKTSKMSEDLQRYLMLVTLKDKLFINTTYLIYHNSNVIDNDKFYSIQDVTNRAKIHTKSIFELVSKL